MYGGSLAAHQAGASKEKEAEAYILKAPELPNECCKCRKLTYRQDASLEPKYIQALAVIRKVVCSIVNCGYFRNLEITLKTKELGAKELGATQKFSHNYITT
jgi:hypothetical protein